MTLFQDNNMENNVVIPAQEFIAALMDASHHLRSWIEAEKENQNLQMALEKQLQELNHIKYLAGGFLVSSLAHRAAPK